MTTLSKSVTSSVMTT